MTACVRDLALAHPGKYEIHVGGTYPELWCNNPHVAKVWGPRLPADIPRYRLSCDDAFAASGQTKLHCIATFHRNLGRQLDVPVPVLHPKGDLHLSDAARNTRPVEDAY